MKELIKELNNINYKTDQKRYIKIKEMVSMLNINDPKNKDVLELAKQKLII